MKRIKKATLLLLALSLLTVVGIGAYGYWGLDQASPAVTSNGVSELALQRGAYLVKQGNCMGCHTAVGGTEFAGGRVLRSEFGDFIAPNITPDKETGIGQWTADDFWRALHNGKGKEGRLLYPAFPFENYTHVSRADADAMWAFLQSLPPVKQRNLPHRLTFPYDQRWFLAWWRALYFRPGELPYQPQQTAVWNRGAYLVRGLAHCSACHSTRNAIGGGKGSADFSGAKMFGAQWYAPSLLDSTDAELSMDKASELDRLLQTGQNSQRALVGPMAEVVKHSLQFWSDQDIAAMRDYLQTEARVAGRAAPVEPDFLDRSLQRPEVTKEELDVLLMRGEKIYQKHCAECHGEAGQGRAGIYPRLRGSIAVQRASTNNLIRLILAGGFPVATEKNPRPFGMPPFSHVLDDQEIALLATYVRNSWGNRASVVTSSEVNQSRTIALD